MACTSPTAPPPRAALEPLPTLATRVPDEADRLAHDAMAASLADEVLRVQQAVDALEEIDRARREFDDPATGLVPFALDLRNATTDDPLRYESRSHELLERDDLDAVLEHRLEAVLGDDERLLARHRIADARWTRFGRIFNALAEPVGRSITSGAMAPWRLARSLANLLVAEHQAETLSTPERQALAHWKEFVENHPGEPDAEKLMGRIDETQERWYHDRRDRTLRRARRAVDRGEDGAALLLAERALQYTPEDPEASELRDEARQRLEHAAAERARSLDAAADADVTSERILLLALLVDSPERVAEEARALLEADPEGPLGDEADFALAVSERQSGLEGESWERFERVAREDANANMARHAWSILGSPEQNPYRFYQAARAHERSRQLRWLAFGPLANGPRDRDLPDPVEWLIDLPGVPAAAMGLPNRLLRFPWAAPESKAPAVFARRYLAQYPSGLHAAEIQHWMVSYEESQGDFLAAASLAKDDPETDADEIAELQEKAARQAIEAVKPVARRDVRVGMLRQVARDYADTEAGAEAGHLLRIELEESTPQQIRVSREFLIEHPRVAGPEGLALLPELLDGELDNGELHPHGLTLLGGRAIELAFVNENGEERGEPVVRKQRVSEERLARVVSRLEEASHRDILVDPDRSQEPDADRDLFFERVRLGLTDDPDTRPTARSTYAFRGTRERYGLVRQRESILPVELVLQVSGGDMGIGAFPRITPRRGTPDAMLYR
ncbi:MAG: hypothetical protein ABFS46_10385 [Myxococcota bacterium]